MKLGRLGFTEEGVGLRTEGLEPASYVCGDSQLHKCLPHKQEGLSSMPEPEQKNTRHVWWCTLVI